MNSTALIVYYSFYVIAPVWLIFVAAKSPESLIPSEG